MKFLPLLLVLLIQGCTTNKTVHDSTDKEMMSFLKKGKAFESKGNNKEAISQYKQCIEMKPKLSALSTSQPRRWCQNHVINLMISCEDEVLCNNKKALSLALDLVEYNPLKQKDITYTGTLARAYAANKDYKNAIKNISYAIELMAYNHKWRYSYTSQLQDFKRKYAEQPNK